MRGSFLDRRGALALGLALLVVAGAGCSRHARWAALRAERVAYAEARDVLTPPAGWRDLRGAIHVHSELSRDSEAPAEALVAGARAAGLDFVVMTEHSAPGVFTNGLHGVREGIVFIRGVEIIKGCRGLADTCATLLVFGFEREFDPDPLDFQAVIDEVRGQGGLVFVAHPGGWRDWSVSGIHGIEVYDVLDDFLDAKRRIPGYMADVLHSWDDWREEVLLQILDRPDAHLRRYDQLLREGPTVAIGGNDAHRNVRVFGRQLDPFELSFQLVTTHVWAARADEAAILDALAVGRGYVAFELIADASGFTLQAQGPRGSALPGQTIAWTPGLAIEARAPLPGRIRLIRAGEVVGECRCRRLRQSVEEPGAYRVEVDLLLEGREVPWILSNPVYVR